MEVGATAPSFELAGTPGELVELEDYLGRTKIVLLFYPLAFSGVCTTELCTVRDRWAEFEDLDAAVFGISVDSPFATTAFRAAESIPFPLLSDFNREVSRRWDVLYDEFFGMQGVSKRAVFVIGTDGIVAYAWVTEDADVEPDYDAVKAAVDAAP
ncbi:MAG: redoxin domain-containing protein [Gemmatimonadetes bacterium]|nr:redoxin domain-containing protein [Gemmatimonadota bacterium]